LAQVLELPHLARLQLHLDKFEPGAIAALAKAPALRMLTVTVPDEQNPASELARVEQLQYLRVGRCDLAEPELLSLQTALPACRIVNDWRDPVEDEYDWA